MTTRTLQIGINAYEANVVHRVGSNMYAYQLLCELENQTRQGSDHIGPIEIEKNTRIEWTIYLSRPPCEDFPQERDGWKYKVVSPSVFWTQWRLPLALMTSTTHYDAFVSLGHYAPRFCPFPSAICILDLAYLKFPQFFRKRDLYQLKVWTAYSAKAAKHIFTISQNSKSDIEKEYHKKPSDISIVYPGLQGECIQDLADTSETTLEQWKIKKGKYIVSIGTIQPRKNMIRVIQAFEKMDPTRVAKLVFVGKAGWMTEEFDQAVQSSTRKDDIVVTGYVDERTKYTLLRHAGCSVLVGYYEGFGIPAIESLLYGVTPVVANTASLPEVVGEFGVLVDPYSVDAIQQGLEHAMQNQPNQMQRSRMYEWARQFSWETSAKKMIDIIMEKFGR